MANTSLTLSAALLLALPAAAAVSEPSGLAAEIRAAAAEEPAFMLSANGVQIFECRQAANVPDAFGWSFVGPDANLYDGGRTVGRHATINHWESTSDRTSVSGVPRASQSGGANSLPWLLLRATAAGETGMFAGVTSIQRVNTVGGLAPESGCGANNVGSEARVAFSADYYFYKKRGS